MPLISRVGRNTPKARFLIASVYTILILGGITMIYPLGLMVSGSFKGSFDARDNDIVPKFLLNEKVLFQRYLESKYAADKSAIENKFLSVQKLNRAWESDYSDFSEVEIPDAASRECIDDFDEFRRSGGILPGWYQVGHVANASWNYRAFKNEVIDQAGPDLGRVGDMLGMTFKSWMDVRPRQNEPSRIIAATDPLVTRTEAFKLKLPVEDRILFNIDSDWRLNSLTPAYLGNLNDYNRVTRKNYPTWQDVHLSYTKPKDRLDIPDWEQYVRNKLPLLFLKVDERATPDYRHYLDKLYGRENALREINKLYGTQYSDLNQINLPTYDQLRGRRYQDFNRFIKEAAPLEALSIIGPNRQYQDFLKEKYHNDIGALRQKYKVNWRSFEEARMPVARMDWVDFQKQKSSLRWEFLTRNYRFVVDFLARHGNALRNTLILCLLTIGAHLIFNPIAAYALSRFGLPTTYKILLFVMATVAFPAEVMMIPLFLQLKQFGLLNSFAALILPGLVHGYSIFLLKGFFDSLPKELYEAAIIDGANEARIFWNITFPLSKPILAVTALAAFTGAYSAFFFAVIICPDEKMWTIMVWLYQLQQISGSQAINYAALCLAAIPTLLVFTFCQRIIMQGVVVPVEK